MAKIEDRALPLLKWMIAGRAVSLDTQGQATIASWLALRAIMFRYIEEPIVPPEEGWLQYFYKNQSPPPEACHLWIARYDGNMPFHYAGNDIAVTYQRSDGSSIDETPHGIMMTLVVGYLAAKVLWMRKGETPLQSSGLIRVWPTSEGAVSWPPPVTLTDSSLEQLAAMFLSPVNSP